MTLIILSFLIMTQVGPENNTKHAYFGGGCFWCIEAIFQELNGVSDVISGYAGGSMETANYKDVSSGKSEHVEICKIEYDPKIISYNQLLEVFFLAHDPTQINRQGNDIGPQYRSVIFFNEEKEKIEATKYIQKLIKDEVFNVIKTVIEPIKLFFVAESYHQNYFNNNPNQPYCSYVINPKLESLRNKVKKYYVKK